VDVIDVISVPKIFRAPMYKAHCAVIFAIALLSCLNCTVMQQATMLEWRCNKLN